MPFIGIVTEEKNEKCIKNAIGEKLNLTRNSIINIRDNNIKNIRNIKFETIILDKQMKNIEDLRVILEKAKYLIVNSDIVKELEVLDNMETTIITYGFNSKSTITVSSVSEEEILMCIQRNILNTEEEKIEAQEIKVKKYKNINCTMAIIATLIIYGKIIQTKND